MKHYLTFATLFLGLVLTGCGNDQLSEEESEEAWNSTQQTLSNGDREVKGSITSSEDGSEADTTVDYSCPEGGTASFEGNYTVSEDEGTETFSADMQVRYDACQNNDITMDGFVNYRLTTEADGDSFEYVYDWTGDLSYSGDINGTCQVDMTGEMAIDSAGASWSYSGSVCGHDADQTLQGSGSFDYSDYNF